jgi:hypothetical protein
MMRGKSISGPGGFPVAALLVILPVLCLAAPAFSVDTGALQVVKTTSPSGMRPGQRITVNISLRVERPAENVHTALRPGFRLVSADKSRSIEIPPARLVPWKWDNPSKAGQQLDVAASIDVPTDFPAGDAMIQFHVAYKQDGWHYIALNNAKGKSIGVNLQMPIHGASADDGSGPSQIPQVISDIAGPKIDGDIQQDEWRGASKIELTRNDGGGSPQAATQVLLGHDQQQLYLAFICDEPDMARTVQTKTGDLGEGIWNNDCVEVFLQPEAGKGSYIHLIVDILGQKFDALGSDYWGFNVPWDVAVHRGKKQWTVEMAIPYKSLGVAVPASGAAWKMNVYRERKARPENSAWRPTRGAFASPGAFGACVFDSLGKYLELKASGFHAPSGGWPKQMTAKVDQWQGRLDAWRRKVSEQSNSISDGDYQQLNTGFNQLAARFEELQGDAAIASGKRYFISQVAAYQPFAGKAPLTNTALQPIRLLMLRDEYEDIAFNLTNPTNQPVTLRCAIRHGKPDVANLGAPGLDAQWSNALPVAAGDGTIVNDAIAPNPAGVVQISPHSTAQAWLTLHVPPQAGNQDAKSSRVDAYIEFQPIDNGLGEVATVPVTVSIIPQVLTADPAIHCFTWNVVTQPSILSRPDLWRTYMRDLAAHGVDICQISSLRFLPRIQAKADGAIPEQLDFSKLDRLLDASQGLFHLYYVSIDIFEKGTVRKDLFGLPFGTPEYERAFKTWFAKVVSHLRSRGLTDKDFVVNPYDESVGPECRTLSQWIKEVDSKVRIVIDNSTPDLKVARKMNVLTDIWMPHCRHFQPLSMQRFLKVLRSCG